MKLRLSREWGNTEWVGRGRQCEYDLNLLFTYRIIKNYNIINVKISYVNYPSLYDDCDIIVAKLKKCYKIPYHAALLW